jgi:hypothetical protein
MLRKPKPQNAQPHDPTRLTLMCWLCTNQALPHNIFAHDMTVSEALIISTRLPKCQHKETDGRLVHLDISDGQLSRIQHIFFLLCWSL